MQNIVVKNASKFNVIYPASKPASFAGTTVELNNPQLTNNSYEDYDVYYEASLDIQKSMTLTVTLN